MQDTNAFLVINNESTFMFRIDGNCKYNSYGGSLHEHYLDEVLERYKEDSANKDNQK
jgi:hypothetical protein